MDLSAAFHKGLSLHHAGRLAEAREIYEQILRVDPSNFDCLHFLGIIQLQQGNYEGAEHMLGAALAVNASVAEAFNNHGVALEALARHREAVSSFDRAVALNPNYADALVNRGCALAALEHYTDAIASFDCAIAINGNSASAYNGRGRAFGALEQYDHAVRDFDRAIALQPDSAEAHRNRGIALVGTGHHAAALESFDRALALMPNDGEIHKGRGAVLSKLGRIEEAAASFGRALALDPDCAQTYLDHGMALHAVGRHREALASFDRAVALNPNYVEAHNNRGVVLVETGRHHEALASCDRALALQPDCAGAHYTRGTVLGTLMRLEEAIESYDKTIVLQQDHVDAHWNKGLALLLLGRYRDGWPLYEWRRRREPANTMPISFSAPLWLGQSLVGKTVLLHTEQGIGDAIHFCRYAPMVARAGARVILEIPDPLVSFIATLGHGISVIARGESRPTFDYHNSLMSLPLVFSTDTSTIPAAISYLHADPAKVAHWRATLGPKIRCRIGIAWMGNAKHTNDRNRSVPLETILPLLETGADFHCLQKDISSADRQRLVQEPRLKMHDENLRDFTDTAALISNLDLVISVDTAVAHAAAALGMPTWILLPYAPDFRWLTERTDSPWYPTARLFRQRDIGDWEAVITGVMEQIRALCAAREFR